MITAMQFKTLDDLYQLYNANIFEGQLPDCIVNMSRGRNTYGFFAPDRWRGEGAERKIVHEISINPDYMDRPDIEWHSTLVHEMCHLWQWVFGKPSRNGYHNAQWAAKMVKIGLQPSDTGEEGGKTTGQNMTHYVIERGVFWEIFHRLDEAQLENLRLKYRPTISSGTLSVKGANLDDEEEEPGGEPDTEGTAKSGKRIKYTCGCGSNVWGKAGLHIKCEDCNMYFLEND